MKKESATVQKKISVKIDKRLDKYDDVVLFPRKVEEAKRNIAKYGLPDVVKNNQ